MNYSDDNTHQIPFIYKALVMIVVAIFVVIGLIGLILPIIPGILFLFLAAFLLSRISSRFAYFLNNNTAWIRLMRYWRSVNFLSIAQRVRLSFWVLARTVVNGIESGISLIRKLLRKD